MPDKIDDDATVSERLIHGSISLIEREGCSALGVRRLAQAAERSSMCVYSHFGSRSGLLTAVYERVAGGLQDAVAADADAEAAYRRWAHQNPQLYALLFDHPLDALGIDPGARAQVVAAFVDALSLEGWTRLHGEVSYARIAAVAMSGGRSDT